MVTGIQGKLVRDKSRIRQIFAKFRENGKTSMSRKTGAAFSGDGLALARFVPCPPILPWTSRAGALRQPANFQLPAEPQRFWQTALDPIATIMRSRAGTGLAIRFLDAKD
jgi:hypothetical protein